MAKEGRINIRLESKLAQRVKVYAKKNRTTVSALISEYLHGLILREQQLRAAASAGEAEQI